MNKFPIISTSSVKQIFNLSKNHPVYRVTTHSGREFVIKADNRGSMGGAAPGVAKFDAKIMALTNSNANIELLTQDEVGQLLMCMSVVEPDEERILFRKNVVSPATFWYKMPLLNLTTMGSMFSNQEAELLRKVFKEEKNLVKLGKIAAVDTFIGNKDRFFADGVLANLGNIFFARKRGLLGTTFTPIGLDFWDGFKEDMNLTLTNSRWEMLRKTQNEDTANFIKAEFEEWLKTLNDSNKMQAFAENTINSLNVELEKARVASIDMQKSKYKIAMASGMGEGADAIKKYLKSIIAKKGMGGIPSGALYRMQLLKWV